MGRGLAIKVLKVEETSRVSKKEGELGPRISKREEEEGENFERREERRKRATKERKEGRKRGGARRNTGKGRKKSPDRGHVGDLVLMGDLLDDLILMPDEKGSPKGAAHS